METSTLESKSIFSKLPNFKYRNKESRSTLNESRSKGTIDGSEHIGESNPDVRYDPYAEASARPYRNAQEQE